MTEKSNRTRIRLIYADFLTSFQRVGLIVMHKYFKARHPGRDSHQAILPDALRVNANLFQTDLCRDPGYMDINSLPFVYHF